MHLLHLLERKRWWWWWWSELNEMFDESPFKLHLELSNFNKKNEWTRIKNFSHWKSCNFKTSRKFFQFSYCIRWNFSTFSFLLCASLPSFAFKKRVRHLWTWSRKRCNMSERDRKYWKKGKKKYVHRKTLFYSLFFRQHFVNVEKNNIKIRSWIVIKKLWNIFFHGIVQCAIAQCFAMKKK